MTNPSQSKFAEIVKELNNDTYKELVLQLENLKNRNIDYSDVISESSTGEKLQWVNFVQEGGGTLGISLVGYAFVMEYVGIRFLRLAGTSAGAINTIFLAAIGEKSDVKTPELFNMMMDDERFNIKGFVDCSNPIVKWLMLSLGKGAGLIKNIGITYLILFILALIIIPLCTFIALEIRRIQIVIFTLFIAISGYILFLLVRFSKYNFGINPGKTFENFIAIELEKQKIVNQENLDKKAKLKFSLTEIDQDDLKSIPDTTINYSKKLFLNISNRKNECPTITETQNTYGNPAKKVSIKDDEHIIHADYQIVTTDIKNEQKIIFPTDADLYFQDPKTVNPSQYVRASMAIPIFFEPKIVNTDLTSINKENWLSRKGKEREHKRGVFVDGGTLSNFPINLFHQSHIKNPRVPIMGVRINDTGPTTEKTVKNKMSFTNYAEMIINTLRSNEDNAFLAINPFYKKYCIAEIRAYETKINWLNFNLSRKQKIILFTKGMEAALKFLEDFNWKEYKNARTQLV
jgi:NTE family protein